MGMNLTPVEESIATLRHLRSTAVGKFTKDDLDRRIALLVKAWRATGGTLKLVTK